MLEDPKERISKIFYAILASNAAIMLRNLHCEGGPYDDEQYDEHVEMEQLDVEPPSEADPPLKVTATDEESPLPILHWHLLAADGTKEDSDNQAPIFRTRFNCKSRGCNVIIYSGNAMNVISKEVDRVAWVDDYSIPVN